MKYLVTGCTIVNSVKYLDGSMIKNSMGGNAPYAFSGIRMVTDDCEIATDVGDDFDEYFGKWFDDNNFSRKYLNYVDPHTMNTILEYREDGSYWDHSIWGGNDMYHSPAYAQCNEHWKNAYGDVDKAVYVFNDAEYVREIKDQYGFKIMMEGKCDARADYRDTLLNAIPYVDIYSVNKNECRDVFGITTEEGCINKVHELEKPCFLRLGTKGAMMIVDGKTYFAPIYRTGLPEIDPTGCGNSSTCAVMWAYFEGYDPLMTTCIANVVSGFNALQHGPYYNLNEEHRREVMKRAEEFYKEVRTSVSVAI